MNSGILEAVGPKYQPQKLLELLHFFDQACDMIAVLREQACEGGVVEKPETFYAQISVLDEAMNRWAKHELDDALNLVTRIDGLLAKSEIEELNHVAK